MSIWKKKVYEHMSSQNNYEFNLLGLEKINLFKSKKVYLAPLNWVGKVNQLGISLYKRPRK